MLWTIGSSPTIKRSAPNARVALVGPGFPLNNADIRTLPGWTAMAVATE
jgi:hypothetical protein